MSNRSEIFSSERTMEEKLGEAFSEVATKPQKLSLIFWIFWVQICLAIFLLVCSVLLAFYVL
jgi:hypothetical protein